MKRQCAKCQSEDLTVRHRKDGEILNTSSFEKVENEFVTSREYEIYYQLRANKEHLQINCNTCKYVDRVTASKGE